MMNKKILIGSLLVVIMLMAPLTAVAGPSSFSAEEEKSKENEIYLTREELTQLYDFLREIKEQDPELYQVMDQAIQSAVTLTDDGGAVVDLEVFSMQVGEQVQMSGQQVQQGQQVPGGGENVADFGEIIDTDVVYKKFLFFYLPYPDSYVIEKHIEISDWDPECIWYVKMSIAPFKGATLLFLPIKIMLYTMEVEIEDMTEEREALVSTTSGGVDLTFLIYLEDLNPGDTVDVKISVSGVFIGPILRGELTFLKDPNPGNNERTCSFTVL